MTPDEILAGLSVTDIPPVPEGHDRIVLLFVADRPDTTGGTLEPDVLLQNNGPQGALDMLAALGFDDPAKTYLGSTVNDFEGAGMARVDAILGSSPQ